MLIVEAGGKRLRDRGIRWKESYHGKSEGMKKRFDKMLPGSYFRWAGFDYTTGHPYYVVVGPAISKRHGKSFFAGVRKLPKNPKKKIYAPSGKYFPSMSAALTHASKMWGVRYPQEAGKWTKTDLAPLNIPRHMKGMEKQEVV